MNNKNQGDKYYIDVWELMFEKFAEKQLKLNGNVVDKIHGRLLDTNEQMFISQLKFSVPMLNDEHGTLFFVCNGCYITNKKLIEYILLDNDTIVLPIFTASNVLVNGILYNTGNFFGAKNIVCKGLICKESGK